MDLLLWILAVILVVSGIVAIVRQQILWGIVLIIVGLLVGPAVCRLFDDDDDGWRRAQRGGDRRAAPLDRADGPAESGGSRARLGVYGYAHPGSRGRRADP